MTTEDAGHGAPSEREQAHDFALERYRYLLGEIRATNENTYRFLGLYQTLVTALAGAVLAVFVGRDQLSLSVAHARAGIIGLLALVTLVALFTVMLIVVGALTWIDYRREECELTDKWVRPGFRRPPDRRNWRRWYETYIALFILASVVLMWLFAVLAILPALGG